MFERLFGGPDGGGRLRLVVGLNQVDKIPPEDWNERLNLPSPAMEKNIDRRCADVTAKLTDHTGLRKEQVEYYSATRRYRLLPLLAAVIRHCQAGFRLDQVKPADPFELADPEAKEYAARKRAAAGRSPSGGVNDFLAGLAKHLSKDELAAVSNRANREREKPPRVALFGKSGVGKTSTVNALFDAGWAVSHTRVGTTAAQAKEFALASGGSLVAVDLPGYGRTLREDAAYEAIYREVLPTCDLVLLVLQADARDFTDDQEMIGKLIDWLKASAPATTA